MLKFITHSNEEFYLWRYVNVFTTLHSDPEEYFYWKKEKPPLNLCAHAGDIISRFFITYTILGRPYLQQRDNNRTILKMKRKNYPANMTIDVRNSENTIIPSNHWIIDHRGNFMLAGDLIDVYKSLF